MPECHHCRHRAEVESGKYKALPFKSTPCGTCAGPAETNHHGKSHVSLEAATGYADSLVDHREAPYDSKLARELGDDAVEALRTWARAVMALDPAAREAALSRIADPTGRIVGRGTRQGRHKALQRARKAIPGLALVTGERKHVEVTGAATKNARGEHP